MLKSLFTAKTSIGFIIILLILSPLIDTSEAAGSQASISSFESAVANADANSVIFVFPDHDENHIKPPEVNYAWLSDWTAIGFLYSMCSNMPQEIAPDTRSSLFDSQNGAPNIEDKCLILFGGPLVNAPVHYYEENSFAPVYWKNEGDLFYWFEADGTRLDETEMSTSDIADGHNDMFVVEAFIDDSGNKVFIVYGYGWKGTFAGGKFFNFIIYPNIGSYTGSFYIFKWVDSNNDGFVDLDEISLIPIASR